MDKKVRDKFLDAFTEYYRKDGTLEPEDKVTGVSDITVSSGYCDTCYSEYQAVKVEVEKADGSRYEYTDPYMSVSDFLNSL